MITSLQTAFQMGFTFGKFEKEHGCTKPPENLSDMCPFSTFAPGVRQHVCWKAGMKHAFGLPPFSEGARKLYSIDEKFPCDIG